MRERLGPEGGEIEVRRAGTEGVIYIYGSTGSRDTKVGQRRRDEHKSKQQSMRAMEQGSQSKRKPYLFTNEVTGSLGSVGPSQASVGRSQVADLRWQISVRLTPN